MAKISNLDFYAILGVHPNAEDIVIRAAFKALAQRYHPDRFNGSKDEAHRRMADLTNAYETLSDPARRRKYDRRRGLSARRATFYFKNPARERPLGFGALAARAALAKQRRYRMAVYGLMVAVVILSAFNIHQHAAEIRELFAGSRPVPATTAAVNPGNAVAIPAPPAGESQATTAPMPGGTGNARSQPIGQGGTRPIASNGAEAAAPHSAEPAAAPEAPARAAAAKPLARPAATVPSRPATVAIAAAPAVEINGKEARRSSTRPASVKTAPPERSTPAAPGPARAEACPDTVAALGLCTRNSNAKGQ